MTHAADIERIKTHLSRLLDDYGQQFAALDRRYFGADLVTLLAGRVAVGIVLFGAPIVAAIITYLIASSIIAAIVAGIVGLVAGLFLAGNAMEFVESMSSTATRESKKRTIEVALSRDFDDRYPKGTLDRRVAIYVLHNEIEVNSDRYPIQILLFRSGTEEEWKEIQRQKFLDNAT